MVIFNAYACDPEKGSEPGLGWNWVTYVARRYPTLLVTANRGRNQILLDAIESDPELKKNLQVNFIPWQLPSNPTSSLLLKYYQPYYYKFYRKWMHQSYMYAKQLCEKKKIAIVHQNTYHSYREPGDFWKLPIPSIWAPVAGTANTPWQFLASLGPAETLRHTARNIINNGHKKLNQRFRKAIVGYSRVVAGSQEAADLFNKYRNDVTIIPGQLIKDVSESIDNIIKKPSSPLKLVFCGLHLSRKGGQYLIEALSKAQNRCNVHLNMIGEGIMTNNWKKLALKLDCMDCITWHGMVPRLRVMEIYSSADAFVFPSINDCYPAVISEAFSCGLPVITTDISGVGDMVDENSGIKVSTTSPRALINGLSEAITKLANNPKELNRLRQGVIERRKQFLFEDRMKRLGEIYEDLLYKNQ